MNEGLKDNRAKCSRCKNEVNHNLLNATHGNDEQQMDTKDQGTGVGVFDGKSMNTP